VDRRVAVYVSSLGNAFFREIAALLAHGFERAGACVEVRDERAEFDRDASDSIVVAPHEFFVLGQGPERVSREFLGRSFLWVAEQPGSEFFAMCLWFARLARGVLDINPLTAMLWGTLGFHARALPLGFVEGFPDYAEGLSLSPRLAPSQPPEVRDYAGRPEDPWDQRPLDLHANAVLTERRDRFFAKHAAWFADLRCALFLPTPHIPISARVASALEARDATALAQRARILLNIHRDEMPYFEWHRLVVRGIWQRALVVTEPSLPVPGLEPGEHFVACELEEMPRMLHWLLRSREGRAEAEAMRKRAFEALVAQYSLPAMAAAFLAETAGKQRP